MSAQITKFSFLICLVLGVFSTTQTWGQQKLDIVKEITTFHPDRGNVSINQEAEIEALHHLYYLNNLGRLGIQGYRIRIYFDLGQSSRTESQEVMEKFMEENPGLSVYRTFQSPYYKVSVGDFRTREDAFRQYKGLLRRYPKAFIVSEWINFPPLD